MDTFFYPHSLTSAIAIAVASTIQRPKFRTSVCADRFVSSLTRISLTNRIPIPSWLSPRVSKQNSKSKEKTHGHKIRSRCLNFCHPSFRTHTQLKRKKKQKNYFFKKTSWLIVFDDKRRRFETASIFFLYQYYVTYRKCLFSEIPIVSLLKKKWTFKLFFFNYYLLAIAIVIHPKQINQRLYL